MSDIDRDAFRDEELLADVITRVIGDVRPLDLLRFGFNALYTSFGDLAAALEILREVVSSGRYREPRFQVSQTVT